MITKMKYRKNQGRIEAELSVLIQGTWLRFKGVAPSICEEERKRLQGPFSPSVDSLLDEATKEKGRYTC